MSNATTWSELYRTEDIYDARAVATSVAGMEFDVRIRGIGDPPRSGAAVDDDGDNPGGPPFVVEVPAEEYPALREVLDEILDEQFQFDTKLHRRDRRRRQFLLGLSIVVLAAAIAAAVASVVSSDETRLAPAPARR